jgi:hypothetical protein
MNHPDPNSQHQHLVKHFFWRFFDLEAISTPQTDPVQKNALKIRILAALVFPGVAGCLLLCPKYAFLKYWRPPIEFQQAVITDKIFFLSLSMILLGFVAVFEWETLLPDRKDYLILTHLPIRVRTIFYAKMKALVLFLLTFIVAVNACPTVLLPNAILVDNALFFHSLRYMACHGLAFLMANTLLFLAAIAFQGILWMLLPSKIALSVSRKIRFVCLMLLLFAIFSFPAVRSLDQSVAGIGRLAPFYPPIWFVGVYDVLLGSRDPVMLSLAGRAAIALALTAALGTLAYTLCYQRFVRSSLETETGSSQKKIGLRAVGNFLLDRCFIGKPEDRATFHFVGQTMFRSSQHILYLGFFLAIGISVSAMVFISALHIHKPSEIGQRDEMLLLVPRLLAFILLAGMKVSSAIPVDLEANWIFRLSPQQQIKRQLRGFRVFMFGVFILPVFIISGLLYLSIWDGHRVLLHSYYGAVLSLIVMEVLFRHCAKIPFTCSYLPGGAQRVLFWPLYMLGFAGFVLAATKLETWFMGDIRFYGFIGAVWLVLLYHNLLAAGGTVYFEEESPDDPVYLNMRA